VRRRTFYASSALVGLCFLSLLYAPRAAAAGVEAGLLICARTILPALLPFLTLSGLAAALEIPQAMAGLCAPVMHSVFGISGASAAPLLMGFTGGYPVGAAATAALVRSGVLTREDGSRLLPFVNNTGPAFIVGAAGCGIFGSANIGLALYISHILAAVAVGLLLCRGTAAPSVSVAAPQYRSIRFSQALTQSVKGAVTGALNICGFVVLFSSLRSILDASGIFSAASGAISAVLQLEPQSVRAFLTGILELGGGIDALKGLPPTAGNLALCSFLLSFGSLSVQCQTMSVVAEAELSTARHFVGRLLHGIISAFLTFLFFTLLPV